MFRLCRPVLPISDPLCRKCPTITQETVRVTSIMKRLNSLNRAWNGTQFNRNIFTVTIATPLAPSTGYYRNHTSPADNANIRIHNLAGGQLLFPIHCTCTHSYLDLPYGTCIYLYATPTELHIDYKFGRWLADS